MNEEVKCRWGPSLIYLNTKQLFQHMARSVPISSEETSRFSATEYGVLNLFYQNYCPLHGVNKNEFIQGDSVALWLRHFIEREKICIPVITQEFKSFTLGMRQVEILTYKQICLFRNKLTLWAPKQITGTTIKSSALPMLKGEESVRENNGARGVLL